jgi:uncharacterized protein (TIGR02246 family)
MRGLGRLSRPMLIAAASAVVLALAGCTAGASAAMPPQANPLPSEQEIAALFPLWNEALATLDPQKEADRYAPDAVLLPTLSNNVRTDRAEIVDYFDHFLQSKPQGAILESHIKILGPTAAIDTGTYRFTLASDGSTVDARYTFVYEKVGDRWLIVNHHSSAMPEGQAAGSQH